MDPSLAEISWCSPAPVKVQCSHLLTLAEPEEEGVEKHSCNEKPVGNPTEVGVFRPWGPGCDVLVLINTLLHAVFPSTLSLQREKKGRAPLLEPSSMCCDAQPLDLVQLVITITLPAPSREFIKGFCQSVIRWEVSDG